MIQTAKQIALHFTSRQEVDTADLIAVAQHADGLGYHSLWTGESWGQDAFTILTLLACHTQSLRLATGIVPVFSRSPGLIAQSIASLDRISQGRAILGLGTSGRAVIENWHGVPFRQPLARTREYLQIIKLALSGERVNHQGEVFQLKNFRMASGPLQSKLPIFLASLGPKNLELAGELADGWLPIWVPWQRLAELKAEVTQAAERSGRDPGAVTAAPQILALAAESPQETAQAEGLMRSHMAYYIGGMGAYYHRLFCRMGYAPEADLIRDLWAQGQRDRAAAAVSQEMLAGITIYGDAGACRAQLERFRANGADLPVAAFPHGATLPQIRRTLEVLAPTPGPTPDSIS
jgi:F420-dependent oxidoreductase-like protein